MLKLLFSILMTSLLCAAVFAQTPSPPETGVSRDLAKWRAANYSNVRYKLGIRLEKGAPLMKGDIEIRVNLTEEGAKNDLILDWRTTQFANDKDKPFANVVAVNDAQDILVSFPNEHIKIPKGLLKTGENHIKINFASPIKTSGAAVTRYVDKEDNAEYIYSLFVPSDASTAFPVFDQPDLKAKFQLDLSFPIQWNAVSNSVVKLMERPKCNDVNNCKQVYSFGETKPISTYVFAFAVGDFVEFEKGKVNNTNNIIASGNISGSFSKYKSGNTGDKDSNQEPKIIDRGDQPLDLEKTRELTTRIYVRKSQAEKFKQHADEVFRLNREGVKFLKDWFDYKFPFPKYDLVLIPEFPFGGMEHSGATFLREDRVIFPTEPTKNDYITRANVIFHEAAHQWFGDTVTMKWFDDLWLKEGFAEFMAYKTLAKVMPEYNAWKVFYERNKQAAYLTDVTRGTTPIYQEIPNLSSAKSAYGNIVYRKAPSFLRQAEFYLGEDKFQTAVRQFLKKHEFANASWQDLLNEFEKNSINVFWKRSGFTNVEWSKLEKDFEKNSDGKLNDFATFWVKQKGLYTIKLNEYISTANPPYILTAELKHNLEDDSKFDSSSTSMKFKVLIETPDGKHIVKNYDLYPSGSIANLERPKEVSFVFPNYQDYGYGIFLLDEKSRAYVLENIQNEKDDFLRSMMWGSLWDSLRFYELAPEDYVKLVIKNLNVETDESTIATLLNRTSTAMNYYLTDAQAEKFATQIEKLLIEKINHAPTLGQRITFYRAFVTNASTENARKMLKDILSGKMKIKELDLKTKDKFDIVTKLITLNDADGLKLLAELEKSETGDAAQRYAYAARAGVPTKENKLQYWNDFTNNKEISESWIESAFNVWNTPRHSELTLPYLEKSLAELPNLKKNRKIFFVNGWLSAFIGGQKSEQALNIVNKFLEENKDLDVDLRRKILENSDNLERAVKIRAKYGK